MQKNAYEMLESPEFKKLVTKRGTVSIVLLVLLFITYYGFIMLVGLNKALLAQN